NSVDHWDRWLAPSRSFHGPVLSAWAAPRGARGSAGYPQRSRLNGGEGSRSLIDAQNDALVGEWRDEESANHARAALPNCFGFARAWNGRHQSSAAGHQES